MDIILSIKKPVIIIFIKNYIRVHCWYKLFQALYDNQTHSCDLIAKNAHNEFNNTRVRRDGLENILQLHPYNNSSIIKHNVLYKVLSCFYLNINTVCFVLDQYLTINTWTKHYSIETNVQYYFSKSIYNDYNNITNANLKLTMESLFFDDSTDFEAHGNGIDNNKAFKKMWIIHVY